MKKITILLTALLMTSASFARNSAYDESAKEISNFLQKELDNVKETLLQPDSETLIGTSTEKEESYFLARMRYLFQPYFVLDLELLEFKVKPMIEFRFVRKPPKGWKYYEEKPVNQI